MPYALVGPRSRQNIRIFQKTWSGYPKGGAPGKGMRLPDWLVYTVVLTIIVAGLFWAERNAHRGPSQEVDIAIAGVEIPGPKSPAAKKMPVARPEKDAVDPQG